MVNQLRISKKSLKPLKAFSTMKYLSDHIQLFFISLLLCTACENREINRTTSQMQQLNQLEGQYEFHVIKIDNCEYLLLELDRNNPHEGFGFMSHRGNCSNNIHYVDQKNALRLYPPSKDPVIEGTTE